MKKLLSVLLLIVVCFSLTACRFRTHTSTSGNVKIYVEGDTVKVYTVSLDDVTVDDGAMSILKYLNENEGVTLDYTVGTYGAFLNQFDTLTPEGNQWIAVYTTYEADYFIPPYDTKKTVEGTTFTLSGVGLSSMTIADGVCILLTIE